MAQCVPFLGTFLTELEMLDTALEDYVEVGDLWRAWGTRIDIWEETGFVVRPQHLEIPLSPERLRWLRRWGIMPS